MGKICENLNKTYIVFYKYKRKIKLKCLKKIQKLYAKFYYFMDSKILRKF